GADEGAARVAGRERGIELDAAVVVGEGAVEVAEVDAHRGARGDDARAVGRERSGALRVGARELEPSGGAPRVGAAGERERRVGRERDRFVEGALRALDVAGEEPALPERDEAARFAGAERARPEDAEGGDEDEEGEPQSNERAPTGARREGDARPEGAREGLSVGEALGGVARQGALDGPGEPVRRLGAERTQRLERALRAALDDLEG